MVDLQVALEHWVMKPEKYYLPRLEFIKWCFVHYCVNDTGYTLKGWKQTCNASHSWKPYLHIYRANVSVGLGLHLYPRRTLMQTKHCKSSILSTALHCIRNLARRSRKITYSSSLRNIERAYFQETDGVELQQWTWLRILVCQKALAFAGAGLKGGIGCHALLEYMGLCSLHAKIIHCTWSNFVLI